LLHCIEVSRPKSPVHPYHHIKRAKFMLVETEQLPHYTLRIVPRCRAAQRPFADDYTETRIASLIGFCEYLQADSTYGALEIKNG